LPKPAIIFSNIKKPETTEVVQESQDENASDIFKEELTEEPKKIDFQKNISEFEQQKKIIANNKKNDWYRLGISGGLALLSVIFLAIGLKKLK